VAGGKEVHDVKEIKEVEATKERARHVRSADSWEHKEFNTECTEKRRRGKIQKEFVCSKC
jgi:hypothetical protein